MSNYRLKIQYDGTRYKGWQRQKRGTADTIQGKVEQVLGRMFSEPISIDGAGRTDAGVHAACQVANFHLGESGQAVLKQNAARELVSETDWIFREMNEYLPEDIRVLQVEQAGERFHSRLNATGKVYEYHLLKKDCYDVFNRKYSWQMEEEISVAKMEQAASYLLGKHDFKGFCSKSSKKKSTVRTLTGITVTETGKDIFIRFEGNGFLYNMVRILTGTLVEAATGKRRPESIKEILESGDRLSAGMTAPARGLTLKEVKYE